MEAPEPAAANGSASSLLATKGDGRNPFSVAVMREAYRNLRHGKTGKDGLLQAQSTTQPQTTDPCPNCVEDPAPTDPCPSCESTPVPGEPEPTHYYVRLKPATTDRLADLADLGVNLSLIPLNEDAAANYQVPDTDDIPWYYTAIPSDYALPQDIQQERLEELYLFNADDADAQDEDPWAPEPPESCFDYDPRCGCYVSCSTVSQPAVGAENSATDKITGKPASTKRNRQKEATAHLLKQGISPLALYNEAMRLTGRLEEMLPVPLSGQATTMRLKPGKTLPSSPIAFYRASGTIRVEEYYRTGATTIARRNVPLENVWVEARRWFKQGGAFTNRSGQFAINPDFKQQAHVLVRFKNDQLTTRGASLLSPRPWLAVLPLQHDLGMYSGAQMQGLSYLFTYQSDARSKGATSWTAATLFNSRAEMQRYTANRNIPAPPNGMNVWLSARITTAAATPMLRYIAETSLVSRAIDAILSGSGFGSAFKQVLQRQLPDITCRFGGENNAPTNTTDELNNTFYHEMSHSIHYKQVGNNFWTIYIKNILDAALTYSSNITYGKKTDNDAQRIAISEGWAYYIGDSFTYEKYSSTSNYVSNRSRDFLENQLPINGTNDFKNWIVYGMYYDMTDNGEPSSTRVVDNVSAYNPAQIFGALQSDVVTVRQFQYKVTQRNNYLQGADLERLVTSYLY